MVIKFLFFIGWIGLAILSLAGVLTSIIPSYAEVLDFNSLGFRFGLFVVSLFYFLLFVEKVTAIFIKDDKAYEFQTENGMVRVSSTSVNNMIKEVAEVNQNVKNVKVTSQQGKKGLKVQLKLDIQAQPNLPAEYARIQGIIMEELKEKLNIDIEKIDIVTNKLLNNSRAISIKEPVVEEVYTEADSLDDRGEDNE